MKIFTGKLLLFFLLFFASDFLLGIVLFINCVLISPVVVLIPVISKETITDFYLTNNWIYIFSEFVEFCT